VLCSFYPTRQSPSRNPSAFLLASRCRRTFFFLSDVSVRPWARPAHQQARVSTASNFRLSWLIYLLHRPRPGAPCCFNLIPVRVSPGVLHTSWLSFFS
jgi:hypothetical protein